MPDIEHELRRFAYKVEAGAEYAITQPVFDLRLLEEFLKRIEAFRIPVIAGIWPLTSLRNAEFMKNDLRVSMPEEIMLRMAQADTPDAARKEGIKIAQEMLEAVRPMVQGVQVSAPFGRYNAAAEVIASVLPEGIPSRSSRLHLGAVKTPDTPGHASETRDTKLIQSLNTGCPIHDALLRHARETRIFEYRACPFSYSRWENSTG